MDPKFQSIIEGTLQLYSKYGIKSVTMDDISKELGISKKTLYLYVKDKEDLVRQVMCCQLELQDEKFKTITEKKNNAIATLVEVSKHIIEFLKTVNPSARYDLKKYYPDVLKMHIDYKRINFFEHIRDNILQGIKEKLYRDDLNPDIIAMLYVSRLEVIIDSNQQLEDSFSPTEIFNEMFRYHIYGIASKKGIDYFEKNFSHE